VRKIVPRNAQRANIIEAVLLGVAFLGVIAVVIFVVLHPTKPSKLVVKPAAPVADPLVYKTKGNLRLVRAVFQGHLYLMLFEHRGGVWVFEGARLASELKS
jgi:hypothetical protein